MDTVEYRLVVGGVLDRGMSLLGVRGYRAVADTDTNRYIPRPPRTPSRVSVLSRARKLQTWELRRGKKVQRSSAQSRTRELAESELKDTDRR